MTTEVRDLIVQYASENTERLRLAILFGTAYPHIRNKLICDKLTSLRERLQQAGVTNEWVFEQSAGPNGFVEFVFRKNNWPKTFVIGFRRGPLHFKVGRWNAPARLENRLSVEAEVHAALEARLARGGTPTDWCSWYKFLDKYADWMGRGPNRVGQG